MAAKRQCTRGNEEKNIFKQIMIEEFGKEYVEMIELIAKNEVRDLIIKIPIQPGIQTRIFLNVLKSNTSIKWAVPAMDIFIDIDLTKQIKELTDARNHIIANLETSSSSSTLLITEEDLESELLSDNKKKAGKNVIYDEDDEPAIKEEKLEIYLTGVHKSVPIHHSAGCIWNGENDTTCVLFKNTITSENQAELRIILVTLLKLEKRNLGDCTIVLYTGSEYAFKCTTEWDKLWEKNDWLKIDDDEEPKNLDLIKPILFTRRRLKKVGIRIKITKCEFYSPVLMEARKLAYRALSENAKK